MDVQADALLFFLPPTLKCDGPLAQQVIARAGAALPAQVKEIIPQRAKAGSVYLFPGFDSGFSKLLIGILPQWDDGVLFDARDLVHCYAGALEKTKSAGLKSLVVPALGKDKRDFPHLKFARLALNGIGRSIDESLESITIACADKRMMDVYEKRLRD